MENIRIAILGYKDFIELTKGIIQSNEYHASISTYQCFLDECRTFLPQIEERQTDVIITGNANKTYLEGKTQIPVITFRITLMDILSAVKKALKFSHSIAIALANFEELEYDYSILENFLNCKLTFISYKNEEDLREHIQDFSEQKGVIIGTSLAVRLAKEHGLPGLLIYTLKNSINESIKLAIELVRFKEIEEKNSKQLKAIIDSAKDGIIAINEMDEVTLINERGWELLQIPNNKQNASPLSSINHKLHELFSYPEDFHDKIVTIGSKTLNINRITISVRGHNAGNVMTLQDITQIQKIEQKYRMETEAKGLVAKTNFDDIICTNQTMRNILDKAKKYAHTESTVLIIGETGTGKELFAQSIHNQSKRGKFPFVAINCGALPESLLESELFGYEDGAFTGASKHGKKGLFEIAHKGTIFLDEINSVSLHSQARLLRVLQEREVVRIGSDKVIPVDVRVIAASNEDLMTLVQNNKFRADLYYRINVLNLLLPPLRNRTNDILPLAKQFMYKQNKSIYDKLSPNMSDICEVLSGYHFPGNVRQLYNVLERFLVLFEMETQIVLEDLLNLLRECMDDQMAEESQIVSFALKESYKESLIEAEKSLLTKYMELTDGDKTSLAERLGIGKTTLYRKLKELNFK